MSTPDDRRARFDEMKQSMSGQHHHGGHGWMMVLCCLPILVIALVLVLTGVASPGVLIAALACTAMMAMMMAE